MDNGISLGIGGNSTGATKAINSATKKLQEMLGIASLVRDTMFDISAAASVMSNEIGQSVGVANDGLKELLGTTRQQNDALDDLSWAAEEAKMSIGGIADSADGFEKMSESVKKTTGELTAAGKAVSFFTDKYDKGLSAIGKLMKSIARIAFYRIVRDAIKRVSGAFAEGTQNLVQYSALMNSMDASRANNTMSEFATISLWVKDSIGAAVMPILRSLIPLVNMVADVFVLATNAVNQFVQALRGNKSWTEALRYPVDYAEKLNGVGRAAKEAKKQIFGFDELNIFNAPTNGGGGAADALDYGSLFRENDQIGEGFKTIADDIRNNLSEIENIVGDFALAVGILLLSTGNIALGMGAVLVGAQQKFKAAGINWETLGATVQTKLENLIAFTAPVLLSIGALIALMIPSALPLGLALIAAGATATGVTALGSARDELSADLQNKLEKLIETTSLVILSLGVILAFTNPAELPLAIGLIAAGAVGLGAAKASLNWDSFSNDIRDKVYGIVGLVSLAPLAVGIILALTMPSKLPLALGLIGVGAMGIGIANANINWDYIPNEIKDKIKRVFEIVSVASLVLGAIVFFTTGDPRGLAMLIAGLPGTAALMIDLVKWVGEKLESIKKTVTDWWDEKKKDVDNIGVQFIDHILEGIKSAWHTLTDWLSGKTLNIKGKTSVTEGGGSTFQMQAEGGFVDSGQMFMARENGLTEMVGTIGNQTAVANNNQIVEGIAAGVERAMSNTNSAIYSMAASVVGAINDKEIRTQVISDRDIYQSAERGRTLSGRTVYAR